jgi:uncharacterized protein (TIGR00299 family) protein
MASVEEKDMKIAYFDCFSGISGDMTLGALLDLGFSVDILREELHKIPVEGYEINVTKEKRMEIAGTRFEVTLKDHERHSRTFSEIKILIESSNLSSAVKERSIAIFQKLAEVEGGIHLNPPDQVHFHEVGAIDSIIDIVGVCIGIDYLEIQEIYSSPLPLGSGFVQTRHGCYPVPAPATIALLEGLPTIGTDIRAELVTPTGAAIIAVLAQNCGPSPAMINLSVGYGVGGNDLADRPNLLRIIVGKKNISERNLILGRRASLVTD